MSLMGFEPGPDSSAQCGGNTPCAFSDWLAPSAPCLAFLQCADPTNLVLQAAQASYDSITSTLLLNGGPVAVAAAGDSTEAQQLAQGVVQNATGAISSVAGAVTSAAADAVPPVTTGICAGLQLSTGFSCTQLLVGAAVIAGIGLFLAAKKR